jgi:hypothetical protein
VASPLVKPIFRLYPSTAPQLLNIAVNSKYEYVSYFLNKLCVCVGGDLKKVRLVYKVARYCIFPLSPL